jgi:hypothetical protein
MSFHYKIQKAETVMKYIKYGDKSTVTQLLDSPVGG